MVVRYFARLRELRGIDCETVALPEGTTAAGAYLRLGLPAELPVAHAVNAERVPGGTVLAEGDELVFLPPIGGG